jgi:hypothetical protein
MSVGRGTGWVSWAGGRKGAGGGRTHGSTDCRKEIKEEYWSSGVRERGRGRAGETPTPPQQPRGEDGRR